MSVGVWQPGGATQAVARDELDALLALVRGAAEGALADTFGDDTRFVTLMNREPETWQVLAELPTDDLVALARFFTLAEMELAGWQSGKKSPVIPIVRELRARDAFTAELRKWIKANTDNRYLPNGSAL